jgi:hypothetical protein
MSRIRWRLRGAMQWPLFVGLTVLDGILLSVLPISGDHTSLVGGWLLAMFFNLVVVAAAGPLAGFALRRRRRDLPTIVAADHAGSVLLVAVTVGLLVGGLVHRPARLADRRDRARSDAAALAFLAAHAARAYRTNWRLADTRRQAPHLYRTCVPGDDAAGLPTLCLLVDTHAAPARVRVDPDRTPNRRD